MTNSCCKSKAPANKIVIREKLKLYRPLIVIGLISLAASFAMSFSGIPMMNGLMGMFLCFLASLKLFNLEAFAAGFAKYDLLAARSKLYGYLYPLIELALGILYLSGLFPLSTNILMLTVMIISSAGVIKTLRSGANVQCACVGTGFGLPVGRVTLFENATMGAMALINICHIL